MANQQALDLDKIQRFLRDIGEDENVAVAIWKPTAPDNAAAFSRAKFTPTAYCLACGTTLSYAKNVGKHLSSCKSLDIHLRLRNQASTSTTPVHPTNPWTQPSPPDSTKPVAPSNDPIAPRHIPQLPTDPVPAPRKRKRTSFDAADTAQTGATDPSPRRSAQMLDTPPLSRETTNSEQSDGLTAAAPADNLNAFDPNAFFGFDYSLNGIGEGFLEEQGNEFVNWDGTGSGDILEF